MATGISPLWSGRQEVEPDDAEYRRMAEFLLSHSRDRDSQLPQTLDARLPKRFSHDFVSVAAHGDGHSFDPTELESEMPLPTGWEKCLHLKTGNIYYLNRATGERSFSDPRKQTSGARVQIGCDMASSSSSSELTVEGSCEVVSSSSGKHEKLFTTSSTAEANRPFEETDIDLNLSLRVGPSLCPNQSSPSAASLLASSSQMDMSASLASLMGGPRIVKTPVNTSHVPTFPTPLTPSFLSANRTPSSKRASCVPMGNGRFETKHNDEIMCMLLKGESFHWNAARFPEEHVFTTMMAQNLDDTNEISYTSMVTVACPNCLMFVMLSRSNPKCPRCGISCVEQMASSQPSCKRSKSHLF